MAVGIVGVGVLGNDGQAPDVQVAARAAGTAPQASPSVGPATPAGPETVAPETVTPEAVVAPNPDIPPAEVPAPALEPVPEAEVPPGSDMASVPLETPAPQAEGAVPLYREPGGSGPDAPPDADPATVWAMDSLSVVRGEGDVFQGLGQVSYSGTAPGSASFLVTLSDPSGEMLTGLVGALEEVGPGTYTVTLTSEDAYVDGSWTPRFEVLSTI